MIPFKVFECADVLNVGATRRFLRGFMAAFCGGVPSKYRSAKSRKDMGKCG